MLFESIWGFVAANDGNTPFHPLVNQHFPIVVQYWMDIICLMYFSFGGVPYFQVLAGSNNSNTKPEGSFGVYLKYFEIRGKGFQGFFRQNPNGVSAIYTQSQMCAFTHQRSWCNLQPTSHQARNLGNWCSPQITMSFSKISAASPVQSVSFSGRFQLIHPSYASEYLKNIQEFNLITVVQTPIIRSLCSSTVLGRQVYYKRNFSACQDGVAPNWMNN